MSGGPKAGTGSVGQIGRVTSASVLKCTGKDWDQWIAILDKAGARGWTHQEIVAFLKKKYRLGPWWQQGITSGFELHIGRRILGQNLKGEYSTVATRSFPISKREAWRILSSVEGMKIWLKPMCKFQFKPGVFYETDGGIFGEIRTMKAGERIRMTWQEADWAKPSIIQVLVLARPPQGKKLKSLIVIQHDQLKTLALRNKMRDHWKKALADLLSHL